MSVPEPSISIDEQADGFVRVNMTYPQDFIIELARRAEENICEEVLARLGYVKPVRCRDCEHGLLHGTECRHFAAYEPIAGGDEYEEMTYSVSPDGFCAWGIRREYE